MRKSVIECVPLTTNNSSPGREYSAYEGRALAGDASARAAAAAALAALEGDLSASMAAAAALAKPPPASVDAKRPPGYWERLPVAVAVAVDVAVAAVAAVLATGASSDAMRST